MFLHIEEQKKDSIAAITDAGVTLSYGEMTAFCEEIKALVPKRSLVFCLCQNSIGSMLGYVAFLSSQIVPLLLDEKLDGSLLESLLTIYQPDYLWIPEKRKDNFHGEMVVKRSDYVLMKRKEAAPTKLYGELALLLTTSGSTGSPKLVRQSYTNIEENAKSIAKYLELTEDERPITMLPMNYTYGLSIINSHLLVGATILLTDVSYAQRGFWDFFRREQATSIAGVPYTYEILKKLRFLQMDLPSLRTMTQAGGKLLPELHKEFATYAKEKQKRFFVMYGQTEATARMSYLPHEKSLEKYGSMGIAIPGGKFRLIDTDGKEIDTSDTVGELVYEGPNVTLGYAQCRDDLKKGDERKGVLVTGDMAKRDKDGYYFIVGRKKRFLKIFGNRVNLDEIEGLLKSHFEDFSCACCGKDDLLIVFYTGKGKENEIIGFLSELTGLNRKGFSVKEIEEIPVNTSGKTNYHELEKYYE